MQKEYFVFKKDYFRLNDLLQLLRSPGTTSSQLITFMLEFNIDVNSYIELSEGVFAPIIYHVCHTPQHVDFFLWLLKNGANPKKIPDVVNGKFAYHILFCCNIKYLKTLIEKCRVTLPQCCDVQIKRKLCYGDIKRINALIKLGLLTKKGVIQATLDDPIFPFAIVDVLLDRIKLVCSTHNTRTEIDALLEKYASVFQLIKPKGDLVCNSITLLQYCINFYLHPLIPHIQTADTASTVFCPKYHLDLDQKLVATLRQLYNDRRYILTCDVIGSVPDSRAF